MYLLKFIFGILLVQTITIFTLLPTLENLSFIRLGIPLILVSLSMALWFHSLSIHVRKDAVEKVKIDFSKEKETLQIHTQKEIAKEAKSTQAKANFKVTVALIGVFSITALFLFTQMLTAGILLLTVATSALGGYYWRGKHIKQVPTFMARLDKNNPKLL